MAYTMYCPNCKCNRSVSRWDTVSLLILILLLLLGIILGLVYLVYKMGQPEKCIVCGCPAHVMEAPDSKKFTECRTTVRYCPNCGNRLEGGSKFCSQCGKSISEYESRYEYSSVTNDVVLEGDDTITSSISVLIDGAYIGSFGAGQSLELPISRNAEPVTVVLKGKYKSKLSVKTDARKKITVSESGAFGNYYKFRETYQE